MNIFAAGRLFGHSGKSILTFASAQYPGLGEKIKSALVAGYTQKQIEQYLESGFGSGEGEEEVRKEKKTLSPIEKSIRGAAQKSSLEELLDPTKLALTVAGGIAGGLAGGPVGAASGAYGGYTAGEELLQNYRDYAEGHRDPVGIGDYARAITKGTLRAAGTHINASNAIGEFKSINQEVRNARMPSAGAPPNNPPPPRGPIRDAPPKPGPQGPAPVVPGVPVPPNKPIPDGLGAQQPNRQPPAARQTQNTPVAPGEQKNTPATVSNEGGNDIVPADAFREIQRTKSGIFFAPIASKSNSPEQAIALMDKKYGNKWRKELLPDNPKLADAVATAGWQYVKSKEVERSPEKQNNVADSSQNPQQQPNITAPQEQPMANPAQRLLPATQEAVGSLPESSKKAIDYATKTDKISEYIGTGEGKGKPITNVKQVDSLLSSNVRHLDYDPKEKKLQVLFAPSEGKKGGVYNYYDVPESEVEKILAGEGTAKTVGANKFRAWFPGKNPSVGKALNTYLKRKNENGELVYPPHRLEESEINNEHVKSLRAADQVHKAIYNIDAFETLILKAQAKTRAEGLKLESQAAAELDDDVLESILLAITKKMNAEVRESASQKKRKIYTGGGREAELKRRVMSDIEKTKGAINATT